MACIPPQKAQVFVFVFFKSNRMWGNWITSGWQIYLKNILINDDWNIIFTNIKNVVLYSKHVKQGISSYKHLLSFFKGGKGIFND